MSITELIVGVTSRRSFTRFNISLPRSFLPFEQTKICNYLYMDYFGKGENPRTSKFHKLPNGDILWMLRHANSTILWHAHVTYYHILEQFRTMIPKVQRTSINNECLNHIPYSVLQIICSTKLK